MSQLFRIEVSQLPPESSSPNWRGHWSGKYKAGKVYASAVYYTCIDCRNRLGNKFVPIKVARLDLTLVYAVRRIRDRDNCISMFKPGLDAIVRAGLIAGDDSRRLHWGNVNPEVDKDRAPLTIIELREENE